MDSVHFSTGKDDWGTPQELFDTLDKEFHFTLDACANEKNHKCEKYYTIEQNGLSKSWGGRQCFAILHIARGQRQIPGKLHGLKSVIKRQLRKI